MIRFIGDIHGELNIYQAARGDAPKSFQVGDFGVGFTEPTLTELQAVETSPAHRFIRGNHDDPAKCKLLPGYVESGLTPDGLFVVGGGYSIDRDNRLIGVDFWDDEQHSYSELEQLIDAYVEAKPDFVVSHECPNLIVNILFPDVSDYNPKFRSRTAQALGAMWQAHHPKFWVFGHWHRNISQLVGDTEFTCLDIACYKDFPDV